MNTPTAPSTPATGTFDFENDTVTNVQGDDSNSIAIFNSGGHGTIANNTVSATPSAIVTDLSFGTNIFGNTITKSNVGIHSEAYGGIGTSAAESIHDNNISMGVTLGGVLSYGIFVFEPAEDLTVQNNTIATVDFGLTDYGGFGGSAAFSRNTVGVNAFGTGAEVSTETRIP